MDSCSWLTNLLSVWGRFVWLLLAAICPGKLQAVEQPPDDAALKQRIVSENENYRGVVVTAVLDPHLDLASRLSLHREDARENARAPEMVVGQGAHPSNRTFVRVLNYWGLTQAQFMAYPKEVRGGVAVAAGQDLNQNRFILTAPLMDEAINELRVFSTDGLLLHSFEVPALIRPPFHIAVGNWLPENEGYEIAVGSQQYASGQEVIIGIFSPGGNPLKAIRFTAPSAKMASLESARLRDGGYSLDAFFPEAGMLLLFDPHRERHRFREFENQPQVQRVYRDVFDERGFVGVGQDPLRSLLYQLSDSGQVSELDVGLHENQFWIAASRFGFSEERDTKYIRFVDYGHMRVDTASAGGRDPSLFRSVDPDDWERGAQVGLPAQRTIQRYRQMQRRLWEPTFTHRQHVRHFGAWAEIMDEESGFPRYLKISRKGNTVAYGEFGRDDEFVLATYATDLLPLSRLYFLPLRNVLRQLSVQFFTEPERMISLEPNHEHEIAVRSDESIGDYNPAMLRGFWRWLRTRYGDDPAVYMEMRGLPIAAKGDAPRGMDRGSWDAYSESNPFFNDWVFYNRHVVNRRLADSFMEALAAGFPPELVKSHQIPDSFAIRPRGFSTEQPRITPIDYAMSAGVGFGFTRFSTWFRRPNNILRASFTSGFENVIFGEYQALNPDQEIANEQLLHVFENGTAAIHCLYWPETHDRGFNATMTGAIEWLLSEHDRPRPGMAGGVGQVVPVRSSQHEYNVAVIGYGEDKRGLLKSLSADGSWEGSVYSVPFRTQIEIEPIASRLGTVSDARQVVVGPIDNMDGGSQLTIEVGFSRLNPSDVIHYRVVSVATGKPLPGLTGSVSLPIRESRLRFAMRGQLPMDSFTVEIDFPQSATASVLQSQLEVEQIARIHRQIYAGRPHQGSITLALLP